MTLIHVQNLGISLGTALFENLTLTLSKSDRLGLVAANGRGKSTLLACLADKIDATTGDITRARGLRIGHVEQNVPDTALPLSMYDLAQQALPAEQAEYESWRVDVVLGDLDVPYEIQHAALNTLSGGWQRTALLAATWVTEPDILLLDEPTNHLDLHRLGLLETWLAALPRETCVVVTSHDRAFLDAVTNRTLFLRPDASRDFSLSYSEARAALDEADASDARRFANELGRAKQLRKQAAKLKNIGINSGSDLLVVKTKQLTERAEKMEAAARPAHSERSAGEIRLSHSGTHAKALISLDDISVDAPDGRALYTTGQKWITPGDRVVLLGKNGTGKTRLVKLIVQALEGHESPARAAPSVRGGYSDQHLSQLDPGETPLAAVTRPFDLGDQRARGALAGAGINIAMQDKPIAGLSGGQKARLAMLILRLKEPNFYLLDEPTNHLDIEGQEMLENELTAQSTACLLVSHDRSFLRAVGNRFWLIERKRLVELDSPDAFLSSELGG